MKATKSISTTLFHSKGILERNVLHLKQPITIFQQFQCRTFASKKHKAILHHAKGFRGRANRCFKIAVNRVEKSWQYAYVGRKLKKRNMKKLWIERLNAGVRQYHLSYSRFMNLLSTSGIECNRKVLADLAYHEPFSFKALVDVVKLRAAQQQKPN